MFLFAAKRLQTWYTSQRSAYGRIKLLYNKSGAGTPSLNYRQTWQWKHLTFLKPHMRNKTKGTIMTKVGTCNDGLFMGCLW